MNVNCGKLYNEYLDIQKKLEIADTKDMKALRNRRRNLLARMMTHCQEYLKQHKHVKATESGW